MSKKGILVLLILVLLLDITFIALNENSSRIYTKSLLVPLLIGFYLKGILNQNSENPIKLNFPFLIGLIFCLIGDLLLLNSGLFDLGSCILHHSLEQTETFKTPKLGHQSFNCSLSSSISVFHVASFIGYSKNRSQHLWICYFRSFVHCHKNRKQKPDFRCVIFYYFRFYFGH